METKLTAAPPIDGSFLRTLQTHQGGKTITDVSAAIRNVTAAVREHCKPGKVVLTLTIYPATKSNEQALGFEADIVEKLPRGEAYAGLFFADDQNNLVRDNPHQQDIPALRTLESATDETPLKKVEEL
jgi:hypothetical protein